MMIITITIIVACCYSDKNKDNNKCYYSNCWYDEGLGPIGYRPECSRGLQIGQDSPKWGHNGCNNYTVGGPPGSNLSYTYMT